MENSKNQMLKLIDNMLNANVLQRTDLKRFTANLEHSPDDPEMLRLELESWYRGMGVDQIIGRKFELSPCPFTSEEIRSSRENGEIILCFPKGITREQIGELTRISSWALKDPLVTAATEQEDCWIRTSAALSPSLMKHTGLEVAHLVEDSGDLNFSLERYLLFVARVRFLTGNTPDSEYWIWLPRGRYDRSGMLIAGFDRNGCFNVHGWMPQFSASFWVPDLEHFPVPLPKSVLPSSQIQTSVSLKFNNGGRNQWQIVRVKE